MEKTTNFKNYKIAYGGKIKYFLSRLTIFLTNLGIIFFIDLAVILLFAYIFAGLSESQIELPSFSAVFFILPILAAAAVNIYLFILSFLPQKITVGPCYIEVKRRFLEFSFVYKNKGFTDRIFYSDIKSCDLCEKKLSLLDLSYIPATTVFCNRCCIVKIKTNSDICYYIPVEDCVDFIIEIEERCGI